VWDVHNKFASPIFIQQKLTMCVVAFSQGTWVHSDWPKEPTNLPEEIVPLVSSLDSTKQQTRKLCGYEFGAVFLGSEPKT
jgi:hypothetical protein